MLMMIQYQYKPMKNLKAPKTKFVSAGNAARKSMPTVNFAANAVLK